MVLICGIPTEKPIALVCKRLKAQNAPFVMFNQREFRETGMELCIDNGEVSGELNVEGQAYALDRFTGIYTRMMDYRSLPEYMEAPGDKAKRERCRGLHEMMIRLCELSPARVVNRTSAMASNFSKPYQAQLIAPHGFSIPDTLITNDPETVKDFFAKHGRVIYKSISGVRSIVRELTEPDLKRLDHIRLCPTQFQQYVAGTDVRVHTIGSAAFAVSISTDSADYRYAHQQGGRTELAPTTLPADTANRCIRLANALGLEFAGIDLRITPENEVYCFEVNPCPAFTYYESNTGQPIAAALARYLYGESLEEI